MKNRKKISGILYIPLPLKGLTHVNITRYYSRIWDSDLVQNQPNLEVLCIEGFDDIPNNFFKYSSKLKMLEILNGHIKELRKEVFYGLNNLLHLKLKIDFIESIEANFTFPGSTSLKNLEIFHYNLYILPPGSFKNLKNLENTIVFYKEVRFCSIFDSAKN